MRTVRRREFLALAAAAAGFPPMAWGQQTTKVPHVAWMSRPTTFMQTMRDGLADLDYIDGKNIVLDVSIAPTDADLPAYAAKAVASKPDVIVCISTAPALAVKAATTAIPAVFLSVSDPVSAGVVLDLAHPGGNLTGTSILSPSLIGKQVAMVKELVPTLRRLAVPVFPTDPITALFLPQVQTAAMALGIEPVFINFVDGRDYAPQFDGIFAAGAQAALHLSYGQLAPFFDLQYDLYLRNKLPVLSGQALRPGTTTPFYGVVHYAVDQADQIRARGAAMVAAILGGAKPADIPVEQPTVFDVAVNTWMARQIGLTIPQSILTQATLLVDYDFRAPKAAAQ